MYQLIKCTTCKGSGMVRVQYGFFSKAILCTSCDGNCSEIKFKPLLPPLFNIVFNKF